MKLLKISAVTAAVCLLATSVNADEKPKRELKGNMMEVYNTLPGKANSITEAFTDGTFYGRLRMNSFMYDSANPAALDHKVLGLGGSMIYKTASFKGFSATAAGYFSTVPYTTLERSEAPSAKMGNDLFSRYNVLTTDDWTMAVLGQAYLQYSAGKTTVKLGDQIFESFLTKSNDTKMMPNTFTGLVVENKDLPQTRVRGAYFTTQKLRSHTTSHDVITVGTSENATDSWDKYAGNDDSAKHGGLTWANFKAAGKDTENKLIVADLQNKSIENLKVDVTFGSVPGVVSSLTGELNYKIALPSGFSLTPGVRHMQQFDNGGGEVGGSSLDGKNVTWTGNTATYTNNGYKSANSLDSSLTMARLVLKQGPLKAQIAYSTVADEADIVAPWRGFPTGGYTRAMAQYNWYANTKTTAAEVHYDFGKAKIVSGLSAMVRYAIQDFDEVKTNLQSDSNMLHIDVIEKFTPDLYAKFRLGMRDNDVDTQSYNEYRFEINYLF
ncbi:outer membrane porin, OprD family [Sulfurimonas aquatica]|uniref:Outer membrane porin, OprD family n=1 Tax=Sulfurimonas aquatica TaxID=2672570 RepID=A0A975B0P7_9BACT|nr:OprD family outer membrane porin [Sulfurimonas aquatica]QSZ41995.1 outer membrane porin, OprD family [Sulfurimonas aquatica]